MIVDLAAGVLTVVALAIALAGVRQSDSLVSTPVLPTVMLLSIAVGLALDVVAIWTRDVLVAMLLLVAFGALHYALSVRGRLLTARLSHLRRNRG